MQTCDEISVNNTVYGMDINCKEALDSIAYTLCK